MAVSAQQELVGVLVNRYPGLVTRLAEVAGIRLRPHDRVESAPNNHQVRDGHPIATDATVRLALDGKSRPEWFVQVEMQRSYSFDKLATLRAYHGSEVRNAQCGGHVLVLSPQASVTRSFLDAEAIYRDEFAFRSNYLSGDQLTGLAAPGRPIHERVLAANMTDFKTQPIAYALEVLVEAHDHDVTVADLLGRVILEECGDRLWKEPGLLSPKTIEALERLPFYQERKAQWTAEVTDLTDRRMDLIACFLANGNTPSPAAVAKIRAATDLPELSNWLVRATKGETAAQIFGV